MLLKPAFSTQNSAVSFGGVGLGVLTIHHCHQEVKS